MILLQINIIQRSCGDLSNSGRRASCADSVNVSHSSSTKKRGRVSSGSRQSADTNGIIFARIASSERSSAAFRNLHVCIFICVLPQICSNSHSTVDVLPEPGGPYNSKCCSSSGCSPKSPNIFFTRVHSGSKFCGQNVVCPITLENGRLA